MQSSLALSEILSYTPGMRYTGFSQAKIATVMRTFLGVAMRSMRSGRRLVPPT